MTCEFLFCFWSDTYSQLEEVCSFSYTGLVIQEVFHVYLNKFENAVTHLFLVIFCNI